MEYWTLQDVIAEVTRANWTAYYADIIHQSILDWSKVDPVMSYKADIDKVVTKKRLEDYEDDDNYIMQGLDAFDIIAEGDPYTEFGGGTAIDSTSFVPQKRGNKFTITEEMILSDRIGLLRQIPKNIAQIAWYTLWLHVFKTSITDNPNMSYDAAALFVAGHNNTDANTLSQANLKIGINKMRNQTLPGASATGFMRVKPKYLFISSESQDLAEELLGSDVKRIDGVSEFSSTLPNWINRYGLKEYIVLDHLYGTADNNHWFLSADPAVHDIYILGFVGGQENPTIITQDNPLTGAVFTNDQITYRAKWPFGGTVSRHEFWYGGLP